MAYMTNLNQAVLFGGWSDASRNYLSDTWSWQGGCWTVNQVSNGPSPRTSMAMAYDAVHKVVVAFGGRTNPNIDVFSNETWLWDGRLWTKAASGPALGFASSAFDENLRQVLLYGEGPAGLSQTWTWDGTQWHQLPGNNPPLRSGTAMAFDPNTHNVLLFGGLGEQTMTLLNDTWAWDGSTWSKLAPAHSPSARQAFAMATFSAKHEVFLVGGNTREGFVNDAWIWNGSDWSQTTGIGARGYGSAVDNGSSVMLFGGRSVTAQLADLKLWDGQAWSAS